MSWRQEWRLFVRRGLWLPSALIVLALAWLLISDARMMLAVFERSSSVEARIRTVSHLADLFAILFPPAAGFLTILFQAPEMHQPVFALRACMKHPVILVLERISFLCMVLLVAAVATFLPVALTERLEWRFEHAVVFLLGGMAALAVACVCHLICRLAGSEMVPAIVPVGLLLLELRFSCPFTPAHLVRRVAAGLMMEKGLATALPEWGLLSAWIPFGLFAACTLLAAGLSVWNEKRR